MDPGVKDEYFKILELLMRYGADPTKRDGNGRTPLELAEQGGHTECAVYLRRVIRNNALLALAMGDCSPNSPIYKAFLFHSLYEKNLLKEIAKYVA